MARLKIYSAMRRRLANYMRGIHECYYDSHTEPEISYRVMSDYFHEGTAVINFAYSLGAMSEPVYEKVYERFYNFYRHYGHKLLDKQW